MMDFDGRFSSPTELWSEYGPRYFVYKLTGRFGNQLLGVSEANFISRLTGRRPIFYSKDASTRLSWLTQLSDREWFDTYLGAFVHEPSNTLPAFHTYRRPLASLNQEFFFSGFTQDFRVIRDSGFLLRKLQIDGLENINPPNIAITVRLGDYRKNPHLGLLPVRYYKQAWSLIQRQVGKKSNVKVYVDNAEDLSSVKKGWLGGLGEVVHSRDFLIDWQEIHLADFAISSNSTFSYTARLLNRSKTVFPTPFYLKQHQNLLPDDGFKIRFCPSPNIFYAVQYLTSKLDNVPNFFQRNDSFHP